MAELKIVGLGGSLRANSTSLGALKVALAGAASCGAATELLDVRALDLPTYVPGMNERPAIVQQLNDTIYAADGLIWSSPLYHGTVSGSFKNALDWLNPLGKRDPAYLTGKVVGLISTAGGTQGLQAVNTMEFVVRALRGWAVPLVLPIPRAARSFDDEGNVSDEQVEAQLLTLGREVARAAGQIAHSETCDYAD
ncbi:MAG: NAD(P)H-dependent oxidoreductase [Anaerolineae bacterium]|nr:NAD(P)H-dependent oxidoreductase [Anaerolineae bacterium]